MREEKEDERGRCVGCTLSCLLAANAVRPQHTGMCWTQPTARPVQTQQQHTKHLIYPAHINLAIKGKHLSQTACKNTSNACECAYVLVRGLVCTSAHSHSEALSQDALPVHMPGKGKNPNTYLDTA